MIRNSSTAVSTQTEEWVSKTKPWGDRNSHPLSLYRTAPWPRASRDIPYSTAMQSLKTSIITCWRLPLCDSYAMCSPPVLHHISTVLLTTGSLSHTINQDYSSTCSWCAVVPGTGSFGQPDQP